MTLETQDKVALLRVQIEEHRQARDVSNEQANALVEILGFSVEDAILANRAISRGADPFAIQYLAYGEVQAHIRHAHQNGPGQLEGEDQDDWLFLASLSVDEHGEPLSLREKILGLNDAVNMYLEMGSPDTDSLILQRARRIETVREKITNLPYESEDLGGRFIRVYTADLGFAAAYWSGAEFAAVRQPDGLTFVGSKRDTLDELGITVDKKLTDQFGIIFP